MSNAGRLYLNPTEKDHIKQNATSRQLIELTNLRGGGGVTATDFGLVGDGVTNNDAAFQAMMAKAKGTVYIPEGTFLVSPTVSITPSTDLYVIYGPGTIKCSATTVSSNFYLMSITNSNFRVEGLNWEISPTDVPNGHAIGIFGGQNVLISKNVFVNSGGYAVEISNSNSENCGIDKCAFYNFRKSSAFIISGFKHYFTDNTVSAARTNTAYHGLLVDGVLKMRIHNNLVDRSYNFGIYTSNCNGLSITNNEVLNSRLDAIRVDGDSLSASTGGLASDFLIANNLIDNPNETSADLGIGVGFGEGDGDTTKYGLISGNLIKKVGLAGIVVQTDGTHNTATQEITVEGNEIVDCSQATTGTGRGIIINGFSGTVSGTVVRNNLIRSSDGLMATGIIEVGTTANVDTTLLLNNVVTGQSSSVATLIGVNSVAYGPNLPASTQTGSFVWDGTADNFIINSGGTSIATLKSASGRWMNGKELWFKTIANQAVHSSTGNPIIALASTTTSTAILAATAGKWAKLKSDGTNWVIMASN